MNENCNHKKDIRHGNIELVCPHCSDERRKAWQKENKALHITPGMYLKAGISGIGEQGDSTTEHMWIKVTSIEENLIKGILSNDPVFIINLNYGQEISIRRKDIEQHML